MSKDDLDKVQLWLVEKRFSTFAWGKFIIGPGVLMFLLLLVFGDTAAWRRWVFLGAVVIIAIRAKIVHLKTPHLEGRSRVGRNTQWAPIIAGIFIFVTGAFDSPMLPMLVVMTFFVGAIAETRALVITASVAAAVIVIMAAVSITGVVPHLMPQRFGGGERSPQSDTLIYWKTGALLFGIVWASAVSSTMRMVFRKIAGDAIDARDEVLASHDAHARELTALSGELAHELKNPLANMKGLAVLISRDVQGKAAERLGVLQGEIDRLGGILQSFLTFSRPLVPLAQEPVDLGELCESVVGLHEGLAHTESVSIVARHHVHVEASCDSRKVKQILINLVQNALEASAGGATSTSGTTVEIEALVDAQGAARIEVRDRGPGIAASMRTHLFQPGMTTKERGSGLGLALARALARQHGGDVTLEDRTGGGCIAALTLPRASEPDDASSMCGVC